MIPELLLLTGLAAAQEPEVTAEPEPDLERVEDDGLLPYRVPFDVLTDRTIGTTSRPVEYDWRSSPVMLGFQGTFQAELNNFNSLRGGGLLRIPTRGVLWEVGVAWAQVWDTPSSEQLALTPYRQPGRPSRIELDLTAAVPLAEGIVTTSPRWFPAVQMVFDGLLGVRYRIHPTGFRGLKPGQILSGSLSPVLRDDELANLQDARLDAMQVDPERYGLVAGFANDLYFGPGLFVSPRALFSVPLFAPASGTDLIWWGEASIAVGYAW